MSPSIALHSRCPPGPFEVTLSARLGSRQTRYQDCSANRSRAQPARVRANLAHRSRILANARAFYRPENPAAALAWLVRESRTHHTLTSALGSAPRGHPCSDDRRLRQPPARAETTGSTILRSVRASRRPV